MKYAEDRIKPVCEFVKCFEVQTVCSLLVGSQHHMLTSSQVSSNYMQEFFFPPATMSPH